MFIESKIREKLDENLEPIFLNIINESFLHAGCKGLETHFKIEIVSKKFNDKKRLQRHRLIQTILSKEILQIKAFSLHAFSEIEWINNNKKFDNSPNCVGGHHGA